jgi:hypothetical protein
MEQNALPSTQASGIYTLKQANISIFIGFEAARRTSNFGDIRADYLNIRPIFINPIFYPLQYLVWNCFIRANRNECQHTDCRIILPVNLGAGYVEAVFRPSKDALDNTALFFERVGREGEMYFETEDVHGLWGEIYTLATEDVVLEAISFAISSEE